MLGRVRGLSTFTVVLDCRFCWNTVRDPYSKAFTERSKGVSSMGKPKVLLADDHILIAEAFKKLLEPDFEVVAIVSDGRQLLQCAPQLNPDVILIDIGMPLLNGMDAGERVKALLPRTKLIALTM